MPRIGIDFLLGDCLEVMQSLKAESIDSIVTDPPYGLEFMGKQWDCLWDQRRELRNNPSGYTGTDGIRRTKTAAFSQNVPSLSVYRAGMQAQEWHYRWAKEALRVAKPGAYMLAFGGTRTYHRLACAIEDAGWEIRDCIMWVYGSGFPKSLDVSKAIDKAAGVERKVVGSYKAQGTARTLTGNNYGGQGKNVVERDRIYQTAPATDAAKQWDGWGTALKPAWEPIIVARKPLEGTVAENVQKWGTGALNIDGCRVRTGDKLAHGGPLRINSGDTRNGKSLGMFQDGTPNTYEQNARGRWPANLIHDGSEEVLERFPKAGGGFGIRGGSPDGKGIYCKGFPRGNLSTVGFGDSGSAARFFYCAKTSRRERGEGNNHPTVKPLALLRYLCRLVTPPNGLILDPFVGSGSTAIAAWLEGFRCIGIDTEAEYLAIARSRLCKLSRS